MPTSFRAATSALLLSAALAAQEPVREVLFFDREDVLGTSFRLGVDAEGFSAAEEVQSAALAEIARLDALLSGWKADSELRRAMAAAVPTKVSPELLAVLQACDRWRAESGGVFHPAIGGLTDLWRAAEKSGAAPTAAALSAAVAALPAAPWTLDAAAGTVAFAPGAPVSVDALAKGYVLDAVVRLPAARNARAALALVALGGDMVVADVREQRIDVRDPRFPEDNEDPLCRLRLKGRALATSGGYARGFDVGGKRFSHILDPRTGRPAAGVLGATVVAADATTADALATILNVLPPAEGLAAARKAKAEAVVVAADGSVHATDGFRALAEPGGHFGPRKAPATFPAGQALKVDMELADPTASGEGGARRRGGYKRPYVAIWVEDAAGKPVKTLCLWVENLRWLNDLKRWTRLYRDRGDAFVGASSSATRKPGTYAFTWDGRDDDGRLVREGKYALKIEVVREHGTYQLATDSFEIGKGAFRHDVAGNVEMKSARVTLGPKAP